ncbi:MAG: hypothetical protein IT208_00655 [Chthonomonadales bacterium]|nr:hypothetical protein [Chthonomonadales bacterium]
MLVGSGVGAPADYTGEVAGMLNGILRKAIGLAAVAGGAAAATAGARYVGSKRINAAERLGTALLDTERLEQAAAFATAEPEAALAACAAYLINTAHQAAAGISGPPAVDAIGFERRIRSDRGSSSATVVTTAHEPESRWQFDVDVPGVARVSGSRRLTSSRFTGPRVHMKTPDTVSIRFENGYAANIESDLEFTANLLQVVGPRTQVFGTAQLSDNRQHVGRLRIDPSGEVSGTVTRGTAIVGRFEGSLTEGVQFKQYMGPA